MMLVSSKSKYDVRGGIYHQLGVQNPWFLPKKRDATMHDNDDDDDGGDDGDGDGDGDGDEGRTT